MFEFIENPVTFLLTLVTMDTHGRLPTTPHFFFKFTFWFQQNQWFSSPLHSWSLLSDEYVFHPSLCHDICPQSENEVVCAQFQHTNVCKNTVFQEVFSKLSSFGQVALHLRVCLSGLNLTHNFPYLGSQPISSILSASSRTRKMVVLTLVFLHSKKSISLPGVAIQTSTPVSKPHTWYLWSLGSIVIDASRHGSATTCWTC